MLGVMVIYFKKVFMFLYSVTYRYKKNYKNAPFKKFIEEENVRFYRDKNIELVGGENGKWLEI